MNSSCTLQNKCRTCFQDNAALTTLFQTALNSETLLSSMLVEIASIKVSFEDKLSTQICQNCAQKLNEAYNFRQQCINVNDKFLSYEEVNKDGSRSQSDTPVIEIDNVTLSEDIVNDVDTNNIKSDKLSFPCSVCSRTFHTKSTDVKRHMTIHTGEKPFKCLECTASFTQSGTLAQHMRKHNNVSSTKRKKEKLEARQYLCSLCGKCFKDSSSLTIHMRRHTGDKPYNCKVRI
ncbi:Zinc finger, C2H2 type [Popillia japonica]|uniref:Zinc finger, C2H2 type n=1 Tax=Popillia japonica TaxID=7064 RepID=A0AAW1ISY6_POPJA